MGIGAGRYGMVPILGGKRGSATIYSRGQMLYAGNLQKKGGGSGETARRGFKVFLSYIHWTHKEVGKKRNLSN